MSYRLLLINNLQLDNLGIELKKFDSDDGIILTDNYAPVEMMLLPIVKNRGV